MRTSPLSTTRRMALYDYYRNRREAYQKKTYQLLGGQCSICGSTVGLRHRFTDPTHPLANLYTTNPGTLYRRICNEPSVRTAVCLVCRKCRIAHSSIAPSIENITIPGYKAPQTISTLLECK